MELQVPEQHRIKFEKRNQIAKLGEECLTTPAEPVQVFNKALYDKYKKMVDIAVKHGGAGIAGPQIRYGKRLIAVYTKNGWMAMANPVILDQPGDFEYSVEGCLSIPGLYGKVKRMNKIIVKFTNLRGIDQVVSFEGLEAFVIQHELQHLDGILFHTVADPDSLQWLN